jgi:hypothetical protein
VDQLSPNALGEVLEPGRAADCYLGLLPLPGPAGEPEAGTVLVVPAALLHPGVPPPAGRLVLALLTGHPERGPAELVFVADLACQLRAELTQQANDLQQLDPMLAATTATLDAAGIPERPERLLADCGYWTIANLTQLPDAPELLNPPARHGRQGKPRKDGKPSASGSDGLRAAMSAKLASDDGKACYAKRKGTIEPVFGQIKEQQGGRRFLRRGLAACDAEWRLLCGTPNLLKLWRHTARPPSASPATT